MGKLYTIKIDDGDPICLDTENKELAARFLAAEQAIEDGLREQTKRIKTHSLIYRGKSKGPLSRGEEAFFSEYERTYEQMRDAVDGFLGAGSCDRVLGTNNSVEMWRSLLDELRKHAGKMGLV